MKSLVLVLCFFIPFEIASGFQPLAAPPTAASRRISSSPATITDQHRNMKLWQQTQQDDSATAPESSSDTTTSINYMQLTPDEWRARLTPDQFYVLREEGTEPPQSSPLNGVKEPGTFCCAGCGAPLFTTARKFDSGTGWPSFTAPVDANAIATSTDFKLIVPRTECTCANCGGHLGHVFDDGPEPTGQRFCMNGVAMKFYSANEQSPELAKEVELRQETSPYRLSWSQVLPSVATNALIGALFFNSFLQTVQVRGDALFSSPVDVFPLLPAVYFGVLAVQSCKRVIGSS